MREANISAEAQLIVAVDTKTKQTREETWRTARDWWPGLANWAMHTPWPFTRLSHELKDKVEVSDFAKYNPVIPIEKPEALTRGELLDEVTKNFRRFYMRKALFHHPSAAGASAGAFCWAA